ncbi:uroporphyrinogen-III synthase [Flavobacteriaceae bacterium]|nr:uroporphyrinogen-III synthase [Flavobacteriaceae bacterium]
MKKIKILSTRKLNKDLRHLFDDLKFDFYQDDFISIQPLKFNLPEHNGSWIFTSKNAVDAVFSINKNIDKFFNKIYCVGENTKSLLLKKGQKITKMAQNSSILADFILKTAKNEEFIFCRSDIKNEEFSIFFKKKNIKLKELVVYNNIAEPIKYNQVFDAILFYSPSGIKSFMTNNSLNNSYCICIGNTTSKYVNQYSDKVLCCKAPTIENVIRKTIKLFNND